MSKKKKIIGALNNSVLIETFNGFDIYFDKKENEFYALSDKIIHGDYDNLRDELMKAIRVPSKTSLIVPNYDEDELLIGKLLYKSINNGRTFFHFLITDSNTSYHEGYIYHAKKDEIRPYTEENIKQFEKLKSVENLKKQIVKKLKER